MNYTVFHSPKLLADFLVTDEYNNMVAVGYRQPLRQSLLASSNDSSRVGFVGCWAPCSQERVDRGQCCQVL